MVQGVTHETPIFLPTCLDLNVPREVAAVLRATLLFYPLVVPSVSNSDAVHGPLDCRGFVMSGLYGIVAFSMFLFVHSTGRLL
jgi:hypothetical protein